MGNLSSTLRHFKFGHDARVEQRNRAVDASVAHIDELSEVLNGAATFIPEAGGMAPALRSIVSQIRKIHSNRRVTRELEEAICGLVELIKTSAENVQSNLKSSTQSLSTEQSIALELFGECVTRLQRELDALPAKIGKVRKRSRLPLRHRKKVTLQLEEVKGDLLRASHVFKTQADNAASALAERVQAPAVITVAVRETSSKNASNKAENDTTAKAVVVDVVPDEEVKSDTRCMPHPPSASLITTSKHMDNTFPPQVPSGKEQRNDALNATLGRISFLLDVLGDVAGLVPVAGLASAVPIVRRIVDQLSRTIANRDAANELAVDVYNLILAIKGTVDAVQSNMKVMQERLGDDQSKFLKLEEYKTPSIFDEIVAELLGVLESVSAVIVEEQNHGFFCNLFRNSEIESTLVHARKTLENALKGFQVKQSILVAMTIQSMHRTFANISLKIDQIKDDEDLRNLPCAKGANYQARGNFVLEGTRATLIEKIMEWVYALGSSVTAKILVLRGEAGTGKSTLAREICRQLEAINRLGGSFFFVQNDSSGLESTKNVIPTIASQLAALQDAFRPYIANAARKYTTFETASLKDQMKSLILDPVAEARAKYSWLTRIPVVIVLDALDEAGADLVNFFDSLKDLVDAQCNFWVFVTTRPEPSIENAFRESGMSVMQTQVKMDDAPQDEVDNDIHNFMRQRFERLQWKSELIAAHPDSVEVLTTKAERLFIYARTVIDYLDHKVQETSLRRLSAILRDGSDKVGLPALDALYTTVLQNAYDQESLEGDDVRERVTALLAGLVVLRQDVTVEVLAPLIGMKEDAVIRTARELRSILSCSSEDLHTAVIRPIHLTLAEFLVDDKRCTNSAFYVDRRAWHFDFAKACLGELNAILRRNLCGWSGDDDSIKSREERRLLVQKRVPAHALYACENWTAHFVEVEQSSDPALLRVLDEFCRKILLPWIEVQSYAGNLCDAKRMLWNAHSWAKEHGLATVSSILFDAWELVGWFFEAIQNHPENIYTTALSHMPDCSLVELYARKPFSNCLVSPRDPKWGSYMFTLEEFRNVATFSRDGRLLVLSRGREAEIRDVTTDRLRKTMSDAFHIQAADVHPNNRSLFTVSGDGVVQLQHILDDKSDVWIYELSEKKRRLESEVAYNTDGSRIACCWKGADAILVWETGDRSEPVNRIPIDPGTTFKTLSLDCDRDQMAALLTSWNEPAVVRYWDIVTGEEISTLQITTDYIYRAAFARKTTVLLTKHDWEKIHVWKLEGDRATLSRTIDGWFSAFDVTGSGDVIAVGCRDYAIRFYDAHTGAKLAVHRGHTNYVTSLRFSPQGDRLVSSSEHDQTTRVWDTTKKALSANSPSATDDCSFTRIKFSSSGKYIAAIAQGDPRVFLWDGETGNFLTTLLGHAESVATLSFSADDSILASVSEDGVVVLWDMQQEVMLPWTLLQSKSTISLKSIDMTFNANSKLLAIVFKVDESFVVRLYDVSNRNWAEGGEELSQSEPNDGNLPHLIHFSPGEPLVLLRHAVPGEEVRIWDQATKTVERRVHDEIQSTWVLPFDIEDLLWITSSKSRRRLFWLPRYRAPVNSDGMDAHGDRLAIASRYGTLTLLDMSRLKDARK